MEVWNINDLMKLTFDSYEALEQFTKDFQHKTHQIFTTSHSTTLKYANLRGPVNEKLKYSDIRYACKLGGRDFNSRSTGERQTSIIKMYKHKVHEWQRNRVRAINEFNLMLHKKRVAASIAALMVSQNSMDNTRKYKKKKYWVADIFEKRNLDGFYFTTFPRLKLEDLRFRNYFRMSTTQFEELLNIISSKIERISAVREPIGPEQRLCLTLRYLASGDSMMSLSYQYLMGVTTVSNIIKETCEVIWQTLHPLVLKPPTKEGWKRIAEQFDHQWQFPHCIGALDGKHVVIQCPQNAGSEFHNYKGSHSIVLMAMCDANYIFTLVDIGAAGRQSDGGIFRNSTIGQKFEAGDMNVPAGEPIYEGGLNFPYVIVADAAFPLTSYLMRPYPGKAGLTPEKRIFNYRMSRARRVIENAFGVLAAQWRIYRKPIIAKVENVEKMIQATICLHNWLRRQDIENSTYITTDMVDRCCADGSVRQGSWRDALAGSLALEDLTNCGSNMYSRHASMERENFTEYFNEEGAVPWQSVQVHMM